MTDRVDQYDNSEHYSVPYSNINIQAKTDWKQFDICSLHGIFLPVVNFLEFSLNSALGVKIGPTAYSCVEGTYQSKVVSAR